MELSKTAAGRTRLGAAAERLDKTVEELGSRFRADLPQGEDADNVVVQPRLEAPSIQQPDFLPMSNGESASRADRVPMEADDVVIADESGEVPPPTDEPGLGETRASEDSPADSMDVNMTDLPETELKQLIGLMHREDRAAIEDANREILSVIKSLGGDRGRYKRERSKALKAIVSEIYSPPRVTAASKLLP